MQGGRYQFIDVLGPGDHGEVWRARDRSTDRLVAVKVLFPQLAADLRLVDRFQRARPLLSGLWHPGIARLLDVVIEEDRLELVTDLIPGVDLRRHLPVSPQRAVRIAASLAGALEAAHRVGVVHGDIKPSNVIIPDLEGEPAVLTDFSVALFVRAGRGRTSLYHPPDEIEGAVPGPAGDVYALGMLLQDMVAHPDGELPSVGISSVVAECLLPDPAARPDARRLHERLVSLPLDAASSRVPVPPPAPLPPPAPPPLPPSPVHAAPPTERRPRLPLLVAVGLTALVLAAVGIVFAMKSGPSAPAVTSPTSAAQGPPTLPAPAATWTQPGGAAFVEYWFATLNYAVRTGDTSAVTGVTNPACGGCRPAFDVIRDGYADGGSLTGGLFLVRDVRTSSLWTKDRPVYDVTIDRAPRSNLDHSGATTKTVAALAFSNCTLILEWVAGKWRLLEIPMSECMG
jgi:Protein kinase domain/Family of unknown function (DUF6318)